MRVAEVKSFDISKREVWDAYKRVKANRGAAGVDGLTIAQFEQNLSKNLYRIWNRMASGSYFPPPVKRVDIPKGDGKTRPLGVPTVADRIAQMVAQRRLEPLLEPVFHADSYGYRPGRSAHDALRTARARCWRHDWVLDLDIKGFFDNIDHGLLMRAVRRHTDCRWVRLPRATHLPLYRLEQIEKHQQVNLPRSTMSEWIGRIGVALQPLADSLSEKLREQGSLHADETPVQQLDPGKGKTKRVHLWAYRSNDLSGSPPMVVFDYQTSRSGRHAASYLRDWCGVLMVDDMTILRSQ